MPQAALGAHQPNSEMDSLKKMMFQCRKRHLARINLLRALLASRFVFQCRKRHLARINFSCIVCRIQRQWVSMPQAALGAHQLRSSTRVNVEDQFQCRKRHLARINVMMVENNNGRGFNAASSTWRASTVPCLKPHDTWPDRAILT